MGEPSFCYKADRSSDRSITTLIGAAVGAARRVEGEAVRAVFSLPHLLPVSASVHCLEAGRGNQTPELCTGRGQEGRESTAEGHTELGVEE